MKRCPPLRLRAATIAALVLIALSAVSAFAQIQSGNIYGKVQAKDGTLLPGVTVTLTGVGAPETDISDAQGFFHFVNLSPGAYTVKAELSGFGTATRTGVTVNLGRTADVTITLNPSTSASITVSAEAPLLDVRKMGTGSEVPRVELEKVPTARDPWVILQQTPGVLMDRNNVGGNESGQQSVYVSKGTTGTQSTWNVDGVNITDFAATGSSPTYYDFDSFEEMQITTGGTDPRIMTPGVQLNMVTKRGTNDFRGSGRDFQEAKSYQATPKIPGEAQSYLSAINQINSISDRGAELGGPVIKDKLWFWGSYGKNDINILTSTVLQSGARFQDRTTLKNENLKVNAQPLTSNSLTLVDQYGAKVKLGRSVGPTRFPETAWNQNDFYGGSVGSLKNPSLWKIEDTQLIGKNLYLTGLYSKVQGGFQLIADNGQGCQTLACGANALPAFFDAAGDGAWHRSYLSATSNRPQKQYRLDGSAFASTGTLAHELKFGYGYRDANVGSNTVWPGGEYTYNYGSGVGDGHDTGTVAFMRIPTFIYTAKSTDAYIGDTVMIGNLAIQGAVRYDMQKGQDSAGSGVANPVVPEILPAVSFASISGLKWNNISPRLGLTYTLGASKRTLLRANYARYVNQLTSGTVNAVSPGAASYIYYYFNDLNHDNIAQHNEIDFNYGAFFHRGFDPKNPASLTQFTRWDPSLKAPKTDELQLGAEQELMQDFSVGITGTYRKLNDFLQTVGEKGQGSDNLYSSADYVQHAPVNATLPNGQVVPVTYYTLRPGVAAPTFFVIRNNPGYNQTYKGVELTATKRMSNRWMLRGNLTLQDWQQHVSAAGIIDPTRTRLCGVCDNSEVIFQSTGSGNKSNVYINSKWAYAVTGVYQVPVIETSLGFNLNERQGYSLPYVWRVQGAPGEGSKLVLVGNNTDTFRNPNVTQLDLRIAKDIRISRVGLTLSVDGFNMLNSNTILQRNVANLNASAGSTKLSSTSNHVIEVLSPRVFRAGARLQF